MLVPLSNLPYPAIAHPEATHEVVENGRELCTQFFSNLRGSQVMVTESEDKV